MNQETQNPGNPVLETERLILRKLTVNDVGDVFDYCSDEEISKFTTWYSHQTLDDSKQYVDHVIGLYEENSIAPWGIEDKKTGKIIGTVGFVYWNPKQARAELAYALGRAYWNKGLMSEAARKIVQYGFEVMQLVRIEARCLLLNMGSSRVMEKCGMEFEGILRKHALIKGKFEDLKLYSIIHDENQKLLEGEVE
ncbi:GNAT family N-acetyltransferase [Paenibacillus sp.]|jgi:ribosomal-protein-alanine N-acetyltransferase|uniref:GNAT family N-acetyltransferase n=1 Tax=Paenibacillus sp. TaxID=58172 RepID=UPI0028284E47|nr:GNAT family N-acetyltransferase [Paenibacillus sp.]MDR0267279.1 GNAT family N-acetyltransferase [Paenibacillus sp.]